MKLSNYLKNETSPYLLQHANNPVNWYPWCSEAFEKAKSEDKPIFLSIGYSTCHWCHVMAHESFEDFKTAEILNKHFISIKVDREERPDIDSVYMSVCQALTGSGGWPMSIFMTWDKKPFFAGTYFPVHSQYGMPGFGDLLNVIADQWSCNRSELMQSSHKIIEHVKRSESSSKSAYNKNLSEKAVQMFSESFDCVHGGFGSAPKFPAPHNLMFLMLYSKLNKDDFVLEMAEKTLIQMRKGGIFDHIGYGFSRYSTDKYFLAPHFEKMLYDNALLIMAYTAAYSISKKQIYLDTAEKTARYVLREMTSAEGGFYCAQDADSEGVEGKFYTFTLSEVIDVLKEERGKQFANIFDITEDGNFEGVNIPNLLKSNALSYNFDNDIQKLYDYRKQRSSLHLDDKLLTSWNAMMISAFSILSRVSKNEEYLKAAQKSQEFIEKNLCNDVCIYTSYRKEQSKESVFLDDYSFYVAALIELYNSTLDKSYLESAERFCGEAVRRFADKQNGGYFLCEADNNELFMNPKDTYDGAIPSGNSVMAYNFVRLYQLTEKEIYNKLAENQLGFMSSQAQDYPSGYCLFLLSKLIYENPPEHITVVLKDKSDINNIKSRLSFLENVSILKPDEKDYSLLNNQTTYYICKNNVCFPPTNKLEYTN